MPSVETTIAGHVATVRLNRPEAMNAVDPATTLELHGTWARLAADPQVRVVVVTGTGERAFCTGGDLKAAPAAETCAGQAFGDGPSGAVHGDLDRLEKPVIAAINGYAIGGGLELALACDIRICAAHAQFGLPEACIGSIPGAGGTQRLPRAVGRSDAMLMLLTGDRIDAAEAHRIGLVSRVVPSGRLIDEALTIAGRIASNAPLSVRAIKRLVAQGADLPLAAAVAAERYAFGLFVDSEDRLEGRRAFAEKRAPAWKGR